MLDKNSCPVLKSLDTSVRSTWLSWSGCEILLSSAGLVHSEEMGVGVSSSTPALDPSVLPRSPRRFGSTPFTTLLFGVLYRR